MNVHITLDRGLAANGTRARCGSWNVFEWHIELIKYSMWSHKKKDNKVDRMAINSRGTLLEKSQLPSSTAGHPCMKHSSHWKKVAFALHSAFGIPDTSEYIFLYMQETFNSISGHCMHALTLLFAFFINILCIVTWHVCHLSSLGHTGHLLLRYVHHL